MKQVNKFVGISFADLKVVIPALKEASSRILENYKETTHPKLRMLDSLIILSLVTFVIQIVHA